VAAVRRWTHPIAALLVAGVCVWCAGAFGQGQDPSQGSSQRHAALFNPDPEHVSNRLYRHVHIRSSSDGKEYGFEDLDPLLWRDTKYLLGGDSNKKALDLLDEFLRTGAERQIRDPVRRAILQRDLWAVFDWASSSSLAEKLGEVIWRLSLTPTEIDALPDTYAMAIRGKEFPSAYNEAQPNRAFLPPDLFDPHGPWICVGVPDGLLGAPAHEHDFSGRSVFLIFVRLPGGRQATLGYLKQLAKLDIPLMIEDPAHGPPFRMWNPGMPQFPVNTEFALVRKMVLPDRRHNLLLTPVTESVQIRHYRDIPPATVRDPAQLRRSQRVLEIKLDRARLFEGGHSGLLGVGLEDREFPVFMTHGVDPFEQNHLAGIPTASLAACTDCHLGPGIQSMLSFSSRSLAGQNPFLAETTPADEAQKVITWKRTQRNWERLIQLSSASEFVEPRWTPISQTGPSSR
jgi:hypothetical protein